MRASTVLLLLLLSWGLPAQAAVVCDGVDDDLPSGISLSAFMSGATGSLTLWYRPTGTSDHATPDACYGGERLYGDYDPGEGSYMGLYRHNNLAGQDRLCGWNWDGAEALVPVAYTNNAATHLAWVHTGGNLSLYKDGVLVSTVASGDVQVLTGSLRICLGAAAAFGVPVGEGTVEAAQIFDTALGAAEIRALADSRLHRVGITVRTGAWPLDDCAPGSGDGVTFRDVSGNNRHLTGDNGPNDAGLTCQASTVLTYPWGPE